MSTAVRAAGRRGRPRRCPDAVLTHVVELYVNQARMVDVCNSMNAAGIPTPGGGAHWWPSHVHRLLNTRHGADLLAQALAAQGW